MCFFLSFNKRIFIVIVADLDECNTQKHNCDDNADCLNTVGSYNCKCRAGYTGDGQTCNGRKQTKKQLDLYC